MPIQTDDSDRASLTKAGLRLSGAWTLRSDAPRFGGFSGMVALPDGLILVSDAGRIVRLDRPGGTGPLEATSRVLPRDCSGAAASDRIDAEAIALSPAGQGLRIALETQNAICSVPLNDFATAKLTPVTAMAGWPRNNGAEAMATLAGRGTLIFGGRGLDQNEAVPLLWYPGDAADATTPSAVMRYLPPERSTPTGAAFLPDGRLLVLTRRYSYLAGYVSEIQIVSRFEPQAGMTVSGTQLLRLSKGNLTGNYEGMAVEPRPGGVSIWLVSDDNFFPRRRTKMVRLELDIPMGQLKD